jgi:hypothetical protein
MGLMNEGYKEKENYDLDRLKYEVTLYHSPKSQWERQSDINYDNYYWEVQAI